MKQKLFAAVQEGTRKDRERAFGVLRGKRNMIARLSKFMTMETIREVMRCMIILHKMYVEERDELGMDLEVEEEEASETLLGSVVPAMWSDLIRLQGSGDVQAVPGSLAAFCEARAFMEDGKENVRTRNLLIDHLWAKHREE